MISAVQISAALGDLGVSKSDSLFVHAGMQGAVRAEGTTRREKMDTVLAGIQGAVADGVLLMPTFTYSFCRGEPFDLERSESTVGMLTEHFRHRQGVRRTPEPIFSTAILGELPHEWDERLFSIGDKDCFGEDSVFAYLRAAGGKVLFFGVGFEYCTYVYHVEQSLGVPYRYMKDFSGELVENGAATPVTASYFVRNLESDVVNEFAPLAAELEAGRFARSGRMAKGPRLLVADARAIFEVVTEQIGRNPDYLLRRGHPPAQPVADSAR